MPAPLEERFFSAVIAQDEARDYLRLGRLGHLFASDSHKALHEFFDGYVRAYNKVPTIEVVHEATGIELEPEDAASGWVKGQLVDKFARRFRRVEEVFAQRGTNLRQATLEEMDSVWDEVKNEHR